MTRKQISVSWSGWGTSAKGRKKSLSKSDGMFYTVIAMVVTQLYTHQTHQAVDLTVWKFNSIKLEWGKREFRKWLVSIYRYISIVSMYSNNQLKYKGKISRGSNKNI